VSRKTNTLHKNTKEKQKLNHRTDRQGELKKRETIERTQRMENRL
jgi:hypothetical protein